MSFVSQRQLLRDHGFSGYHLGYEYYSTSDVVYIWKKSPYIPILAAEVQDFYKLSDSEILMIVWENTLTGYKKLLEELIGERDKLVADRIKVKNSISGISRVERYKVMAKMRVAVQVANKKVAKAKENVIHYKSLLPKA